MVVAMVARVGVLLIAIAAVVMAPSPPVDGSVIRVPHDQPTLVAAIAAAGRGAVIELDRGTYDGGIVVPEERPGITIRGVDRNEVVFDGRDVEAVAIEIEADGVTLENLSAHNFTGNGFYWDAVDGFAGRYLSVWNVGSYGIYAIESRAGVFEDSLVSGAGDAAFYIGECNPCDSVLRDLIARYSAVGYSGTNAGGNLEVRDSLWELNGTGIMPNSYNEQRGPPPQHDSLITGNTVRGSGSVPVPANSPLAGFVGMGIAIAGGQDNVVSGNRVEESARYGIALYPTLQRDGSSWLPDNNRIEANEVSGSGIADLAAAEGARLPSCFAGNRFTTSLPVGIEEHMACGRPATADGDPRVSADLAVPPPVALDLLGPRPAYTEMPAPERQPPMPARAVPANPIGSPAVFAALALAAVALIAAGARLAMTRRER
jgi:hypothetical protein